MGVATSLTRVAPQCDRFSESLRRGGRSSCLHVHVPLAHVARGSVPCLQRLSLQLRARTHSSSHQAQLSSFHKALTLSSHPHSSQKALLKTPLHTPTLQLRTSLLILLRPVTRLGRGKLAPIPLCTQIGHRLDRFLTHFSTPPRSGNEGVSPGTEGNRREKRAGNPARTVVVSLVPRRDRDHTVQSPAKLTEPDQG